MADRVKATEEQTNDGDGTDVDVAANAASASIEILTSVAKVLKSRKRQERMIGCTATTEKSTKRAIVQLKDQLKNFQQQERIIKDYTEQLFCTIKEDTQRRIRGLFDSSSLLLSLDERILKHHVLVFLDEQSLLSLEQASATIERYHYVDGALKILHELRIQKTGYVPILAYRSNDIDTPWLFNARRRAEIFADASAFAERMEKVAAEHYDYDQQKVGIPTHERKKPAFSDTKDQPSYKDLTVKCSGCSELDEMSNPVSAFREYNFYSFADAIFVRLSYRQLPAEANSTGLIWQGFVKHKKKSRELAKFDLTERVKDMDWPELHSFLAELEKSTAPLSANARKERLRQREHLVRNLAVTVVLVASLNGTASAHRRAALYRPGVFEWDPLEGKGSYLMMATGGVADYHSNNLCNGDTVQMQPRHKRGYHEKEWRRRISWKQVWTSNATSLLLIFKIPIHAMSVTVCLGRGLHRSTVSLCLRV